MSDLRRLLGLFRRYRGWLALGILLSFVTTLANVGLMAISGWFITAMAIAGTSGVSMNYFTPAAMIRGMAIVRTAGRYAERLVTHEATFHILAELRTWFYLQLEPLAPGGLEPYRSGDLLSRIRADIDTLDKVYLRLLVPTVVAVLAVALFIAVLALYASSLALAEGMLLVIAGAVVPWLMHRLGRRHSRRLVESAARMRAGLVNDLQGMGELLVYGAAERHAGRLQGVSGELAAAQRSMSRLHGTSQATTGLCANLAMWLMVLLATPMVATHTLAPADLTMLALFALASFEAVLPLPLAFQTLGESLAAARRIFSLADTPASVTEPDRPLSPPAAMRFQLDKVGFRYPGAARHALQGIDLQWEAGQCWAVVGASGSGKSTLAKLLLRFLAPNDGRLRLGEAELAQYGGEELRRNIAVAAQQVHMFNATIRDNLLLARPDAQQEEIEAACRTAMIHGFISEQPAAYDTVTGETGVRLSGGQARRLAVARALLKDAPALILDEPTEGLDPDTASHLMNNLLAHVRERGQSLLVITHRLEGLETFDGILVLDAGRAVESGSHDELLARRGRYHHVYTSGVGERELEAASP